LASASMASRSSRVQDAKLGSVRQKD
jgi:hypothetical protein